ncbi:protein of unknown function (plasmid) [Caballeronia sp. S22]
MDDCRQERLPKKSEARQEPENNLPTVAMSSFVPQSVDRPVATGTSVSSIQLAASSHAARAAANTTSPLFIVTSTFAPRTRGFFASQTGIAHHQNRRAYGAPMPVWDSRHCTPRPCAPRFGRPRIEFVAQFSPPPSRLSLR